MHEMHLYTIELMTASVKCANKTLKCRKRGVVN